MPSENAMENYLESHQRMMKLVNAISDVIREMEKDSDESVRETWNEALESWETRLLIDHRSRMKRLYPRTC
jgi:hypothetical protein